MTANGVSFTLKYYISVDSPIMDAYSATKASFEDTYMSDQSSLHKDRIEDNNCDGYGKEMKDEISSADCTPNFNNSDQAHMMVEFQNAIDRLKLRRQSSTSSQHGVYVEKDGSRKNSAVRGDFSQGQKFRTSTTAFSSTCTSPISSNGENEILHFLISFNFIWITIFYISIYIFTM